MPIEIIANVPKDNGKAIRTSNGTSYTVAEQACDCGAPCSVVVKGETDSFGFETLSLCDNCFSVMKSEIERYEQALDVEDRSGYFYIGKCSNDDRKNWDYFTESFRDATAFLRKIEGIAEKHGGLYPNNDILECTQEEYERLKKSVADATFREIADFEYEDFDDWEDPRLDR